jgi:hypothetical protein
MLVCNPLHHIVHTIYNTASASATPNIRTEVHVKEPSTPPPSGLDEPLRFLPTTPKRRVRKRDFNFFIETNLADVPLGPATQRSKRLPKRVPLSVRLDSANSTPSPSPLLPATPYSLSPGDSFWIDNKENWDRAPWPTPPPTPALSPTSPAGPPPPPSPRARIIRPSPTPTTTPPCNMALYQLLGLDSWNVTRKEIKTAWRKKALGVHPDRAAQEDREAATLLMQKLNAAVEVLSDCERRRQYHEDGVLPWAV